MNSGDLTIQDTVVATDNTNDGVRAGLIDIQSNNGHMNIGTSSGANIQSINTVDEDVDGGLGTDPSNQVAIRLLQLSSLDATRNVTLGDDSGSDVVITATGGDILIDALGGAAASGSTPRSVFLNSDVSILATDSIGGTNGTITLDGVDNTNVASLIAGTNRAVLLRGSVAAQSNPSTSINFEDEIATVSQTESTLAIDDIQSDIDKQFIAESRKANNSYDRIFNACKISKNNQTESSQCKTENTLKTFLNSFLIGGELPSVNRMNKR